jgi:hypothetical protein
LTRAFYFPVAGLEYDLKMTQDNRTYLLLAGDAVVIFVVAVVGFLSHSESPLVWVNRFLATWIPFTTAWIAAGIGLGLYADDDYSFGRLILAALLAAPLGALLRGLWLGTVVQTTFVLVMTGVLGLGMIVWRWIWSRIRSRTPA